MEKPLGSNRAKGSKVKSNHPTKARPEPEYGSGKPKPTAKKYGRYT